MGHIFISYSHKDKEYVHKLQEALQNDGFEVWIDDRVDYGSEWPKVIQKHLDECDAFIVVISENAYESKWVQNELARAERKRKPMFPLLLSGEAWLSVETTQYVDVRGQELPPEDFFRRLEVFTQKETLQLSHDLEMVTFEWLTYTNTKYSFSFKYPPNGDVFINEENCISIQYSTIPGTNLRRKRLTARFERKDSKSDSISSEIRRDDGFLVERKKVKVNDRRYLSETFSQTAMGKTSKLRRYTTTNKEGMAIFELEIMLSDQGSHAYLLPKIDLEAEEEMLLYVLYTFHDQPNSYKNTL